MKDKSLSEQGGYWIHGPDTCVYVTVWGKVTFSMCRECIEKLYGKEEVMQVPKVQVEVRVSEFIEGELAMVKARMIHKELQFTCTPEKAERVFKAACDAAREESNGKEETSGGAP